MNQIERAKKQIEASSYMPKTFVVLCWVWIGIWLAYKLVQISKGYALDAFDFSNPSLAGIIAIVCIILLILNSRHNSSNSKLPEEIKCPFCDNLLELEELERIERKFTCPECNKVVDLN